MRQLIARIWQDGNTSAPSIHVFSNTLREDVSLHRDAAGFYKLVSPGAFGSANGTLHEVWCSHLGHTYMLSANEEQFIFKVSIANANELSISTTDLGLAGYDSGFDVCLSIMTKEQP